MHNGDPDEGVEEDGDGAQAPAAFRTTLVRVLVVQVIALLLLWLLQSRFGG